MSDLGSLVISLTAETAQFKDALTKAAYQMDQNVGQMVTAAEGLTASLAAVDAKLGALGINLRNVMGIAAAGGILELAANSIEAAAHVELLSQKTGIAADQLAAMKGAATAGGVSLDDVASASEKLSKSVESGSSKARTALAAMGLSMADLQKQSPAEMMHTVAQRMNEMEDGGKKVAAVQMLIRGSGAELLPFFKQYGDQVNLVKQGYGEFAENAHQFEIQLGKLKATSQGIVNHYVAEFLPVLIAVIDGIDRFRNIIIAAAIAFGLLPIATIAATAAYGTLTAEMVANSIAAELGMVQTNLLTTSLWGTTIAATAATGAMGLLKIAAGTLFAAYAGWQFGSWLSEQFLSVKLAGIAMVDGLLTAWESLKYGAQVAWAAIKYVFEQGFEGIQVDFGSMLKLISDGMSHIPGLGDAAASLGAFADTLTSKVGVAVKDFAATLDGLSAEYQRNKAAVHSITSDMADNAIEQATVTKATKETKDAFGDLTSNVGKAAKQVVDYTNYLKAWMEVQKALNALTDKADQDAIKQQLAHDKQAYDAGLTNYAAFWQQKNQLQSRSLDIEETRLRANLAAEKEQYKSLLDSITTMTAQIIKDGQARGDSEDTIRVAVEKMTESINTKLLVAYKDQLTTTAQLNDIEQKRLGIGADVYDMIIKNSDGLYNNGQALNSEIAKLADANAQFGLNAQQVAAAKQAQLDHTAAVLLANPGLEGAAVAVQALADKYGALSKALADKQALENSASAFREAFDVIAGAADTLWNALKKGGSGTAAALRDYLKNTFYAEIEKLFLKPLVLQVVMAVTGAGAGLANAAGLGSLLPGGSSNGFGLFGNLFGAGSNVVGSGSLASQSFGAGTGDGSGVLSPISLGVAGGAARGSWAGVLGGAVIGGAITSQYGSKSPYPGIVAGGIVGYAATAGIAAAGTALAAGATAATAATTAFAAAAAAVPVIGWIVAAIAIIASFVVKPGGGPKSGGSSLSSYDTSGGLTQSRGDFYTPNDQDSALAKFTQGIGTTYLSTIATLGGKAGAVAFGIGYDTDPQGTAQNRLSESATVNGKQVYGFQNLELGRDSAVLQARMTVEAQRMLLAAVQASELPDDIANLLDNLSPAALGADQIANVLAYAGAFHSLPEVMKAGLAGITGLAVTPETSVNLAKFGAAFSAVVAIVNADPGKDVQTILDASNQTAIEKFRAQADALHTMATQFDGSADAALNLAQATATYYQNMVQLLVALDQATASFHKSIQDLERSINLGMMNPEQQQAFYQNEINQMQANLAQAALHPGTADPASVAEWAQQAQSDYKDWWSTLSDTQKQEQQANVLANLNALDQQLAAANKAISDSVKAQNDPNNPNSPIAGVKSAFDKFMLDMGKWLEDNKGVAQTQIDAATLNAQAAQQQLDAAELQQAAANTPITVNVNNGGSEVTAGA